MLQDAPFGGLEGLSELLQVDLSKGLKGSDYEKRRAHFGHNELPKIECEGFWEKFWGAI